MRRKESLALTWLWLLLVAITVCVFCYPVQAQTGNAALDLALSRKPQYATVLNGTPYWSKTSPNSMDLNGSENCTNPGFETNTTGWGAGTNATIKRNTVTFRSGVASGELTMSGTDGATERTIYTFFSNTSTNKFTAEAWVYAPVTNTQDTVKAYLVNQGFAGIGVVSYTKITKGTWTKIVLNRQAPGTQTSIGLDIGVKSSLSASDTLFIDDASLTQAWDGMVVAIFKTNMDAGVATRAIAFAGTTHAFPAYDIVQSNTTNYLRCAVGDGTTTVDMTGATPVLNDGRWHIGAFRLQRDGNAIKSLDGVDLQTSSIASIGKITTNETTIGAFSTPAAYFSGLVGQIQFIRFSSLPSNISTIISNIASTYKSKGLPKQYSGGTIVLDVDWKAQGTDKSGTGNTLTPTGGPTTQKVKY